MELKPHPICGHLKPLFAHRESGPCDWCLTDIDREYIYEKPVKTWEDIRSYRAVLLAPTDWVETQPARVARSPATYVEALIAYRQKLFDITKDFDDPEKVVWPELPLEADYK